MNFKDLLNEGHYIFTAGKMTIKQRPNPARKQTDGDVIRFMANPENGLQIPKNSSLLIGENGIVTLKYTETGEVKYFKIRNSREAGISLEPTLQPN